MANYPNNDGVFPDCFLAVPAAFPIVFFSA